jgi:tetratricopeptide (TPR) repeat protein
LKPARPDGSDSSLPPFSGRSDGTGGGRVSFGTVSTEHYVVEREIARGGQGRIRLAHDRRLGRKVALKESLVTTGDAARRFEREARITARLQHPSIVNVHEAGVWPSGEPFYAMKLVTGRSLHTVFGQAKTLAERIALLPNLLAVADAIAYAHSQRVIHRDLKPGNVLVGEYGETVVVDWGLAKDLGEPETPLAHGSLPPDADAWQTSAGTVVGTPAYMAPEQARGMPVDERADVYAIGAMLDHALSGDSPYVDVSDAELLAAIKCGPPIPLAQRQPGVPPDLLAIVKRAMAYDASARYPTARELAEDLRRYQTGQLVGAHHYSTGQLVRRWLRRHRGSAIVAAVATAVLLVVGGIALQRTVAAQHLAEEQRARAEKHSTIARESRDQAEELMSFMLVKLRNKLEPIGRLDLLDDVAKQTVTYYDSRRGEELTTVELGKRALSRGNLAGVLFAQGHADGALHEYVAARAIYSTLAVLDNNASVQHDLAVSHYRIAQVLLAQAKSEAALVELRMALAISKPLATTASANLPQQRQLAMSQATIGDVLFTQGLAAQALNEYRAAMSIYKTLVVRHPHAWELQEDLAITHNKVGNVILAQGDAAAALAEYRAYLALSKALLAQDPTDTLTLRNVAVSHGKIGEVLSIQGDGPGSLAAYEEYLAICDKLATSDPTNADNQADLSVAHAKVGEALFAQRKLAAALTKFRTSMTIATTLATNDPTNVSRQRALSTAHLQIGTVLEEQGGIAEALEHYRMQLAIAKALVAKDPTNADNQFEVAAGHQRVGDVLLKRHDPRGALVEFRAMFATLDALAKKDSTNTDRQRDLSVGHEKLGDVLLAQGDAVGALAEYRLGLAIADRLATLDTTNTGWQADVAGSYEKVGDGLLASGNRAEALKAYRTSLELLQRLQARSPRDAGVRVSAGKLATKIARCCAAKLRREQ